jgi:Zn-dependent metalloprotease
MTNTRLNSQKMRHGAWLRGSAVPFVGVTLLGLSIGCGSDRGGQSAASPAIDPEAAAILALPADATDKTLGQLGFDSAALGSYGTPMYLSGHVPLNLRSAEDVVQVLQTTLRSTLRLSPQDSLTVRQTSRDAQGRLYVRVQQRHQGLLVLHKEVAVQVDADGAFNTLLGELVPNLRLVETAPALTADAALSQALSTLIAEGQEASLKIHEAPTQVVFVDGPRGEPVLAYRALVEFEGRDGFALEELVVQASTARVLGRFTQRHEALNRQMFDFGKKCLSNPSSLPGTASRKEGDMPVTDVTVNKVYDGVGNTYHFYKYQNDRDSFDDKGAALKSSVHVTFNSGFSCTPNNAAWLGNPYFQMVYGDGDGTLFVNLAHAFDVSAHELTHAVTSATSQLIYQNESGALNEGMSDIEAAAAEAWLESGGGPRGNPTSITPSMATWLIGEAAAGPMLPGGALRFMADPTKDMSSKDNYAERIMPGGPDRGGVHYNSGIPNLAFYLLSEGGVHPRNKTKTTVSGIGIEKAQRIFYLANTKLFAPGTTFQQARLATAKAAENLYGRCSQEWAAMHMAWDAVGVPGAWSLCVTPPNGF